MNFKRFLFVWLFLLFVWNDCTFAQNANPSQGITPDSIQQTIIDLNWTERETTEIGGIIPGKIFLRGNASEENFKKHGPNASIIHLATHSIINENQPIYSKLVFSQKDTLNEDGMLHTYELYNLALNANMAVLSACNTGTGKLIQGEGIMSLARGFMYAGCPSVVMSLWPVDDKSTSKIMKKFYTGLTHGLSKEAALRTAKMQYLKNAGDIKSAPYYWAGFVLIGDTDPMELKKKHNYLYWILPLIILSIFVFILFQKKLRTH